MIKNSVPVSAIPGLSPEEKQNHMIGLFTSIDQSLKKLLMWAEPSAGAGMIEKQYEMAFGPEVEYELKNILTSDINEELVVQAAEKIAAAKPRAPKKVATPVVPVAPVVVTTEQFTAPVETTLAAAPVVAAAPVEAPVVAPAAPAVTIDEVRKAAERFIIELTGKGQNGKELFSNLLKAQGSQILTALDKTKYPALLAEMAKIVPAVAAQVFDPLA
ncbi:hypothetical protein UFOVP1451_21 [uncultured Caudovirales phage]|uniref:Uncharacterized protein n=1 Tax=uncultured Caudovirales phage TaxID=2100421 RepID=A0A6J5SGC5_9CAUD|nr:hypothetical protein UFOVP1451_21 [uncultured Caudovirales phage]